MLNFCRNSCIDINKETVTSDEKKCLKNCTTKYTDQFKTLNNFQQEFMNKYGSQIFLVNDEQKEAMKKYIEYIHLNNI